MTNGCVLRDPELSGEERALLLAREPRGARVGNRVVQGSVARAAVDWAAARVWFGRMHGVVDGVEQKDAKGEVGENQGGAR